MCVWNSFLGPPNGDLNYKDTPKVLLKKKPDSDRSKGDVDADIRTRLLDIQLDFADYIVSAAYNFDFYGMDCRSVR